MQLFSFLIALCLLVLAVVVAAYLGWLIFLPLLSLLKGGRDSSRIRKAAQKLDRADRLIDAHKCMEALKLLKRSVIFETAHTPRVALALKEHHQNLLSRCLVIAEELSSRAENLAEVERLFIERYELQTLYLKAADSYQNVKYRRERAGKNLPPWSKSEFEQRIVEIKKELQRNEKALQDDLAILFDSLGKPSSENIIYH